MAGTDYQTARDIRARSFLGLQGTRRTATLTTLTALDPTAYTEGLPVYVKGTGDVYTWDSTNSDTPDGDLVIQPDDWTGDGRWLKRTELPTNPGGLPGLDENGNLVQPATKLWDGTTTWTIGPLTNDQVLLAIGTAITTTAAMSEQTSLLTNLLEELLRLNVQAATVTDQEIPDSDLD